MKGLMEKTKKIFGWWGGWRFKEYNNLLKNKIVKKFNWVLLQ